MIGAPKHMGGLRRRWLHRLARRSGEKFVLATQGQGEEHIAIYINNYFLVKQLGR
jgi:hypothetical protein